MSTFPRARWVFFDVGYTLLDETPAWRPLFVEMAAVLGESGRSISVDDIWREFHRVAEEFESKQWIGLCRRLSRTPEECDRLTAIAARSWRHELQVPHARAGEVLRVMSSRLKLGIIANQWIGTAERMKSHGWADYFGLIIGSAEAGVQKPDPKIFQLALQHAECPADQAVMIGDRIDNDIKPAKALGMGTVHVRQGIAAGQHARNASEVADATVNGIAQVPALFGLGE